MKKFIPITLFHFFTVFGLEPEDFLGAWELNGLPNANPTFAFKSGFENSDVYLQSTVEHTDLVLREGRAPGDKAITTKNGEKFLEIIKTNTEDSLYAYSIAFEFMIEDSIKPNSPIFRLGNLYGEGLNFSFTGELGNWNFLFDQEKEPSIVKNHWYQIVLSIKVGVNIDDPTSSFILYVNGVPAYSFKPSYYQDVSGGKYFPYQFNKSLFIDAPIVSKIAILKKNIDSQEVVELQSSFFNTVGINRRITDQNKPPLKILKSNNNIQFYSKSNSNFNIRINNLRGNIISVIKITNGYGSLKANFFPKGLYLFSEENSRFKPIRYLFK